MGELLRDGCWECRNVMDCMMDRTGLVVSDVAEQHRAGVILASQIVSMIRCLYC